MRPVGTYCTDNLTQNTFMIVTRDKLVACFCVAIETTAGTTVGKFQRLCQLKVIDRLNRWQTLRRFERVFLVAIVFVKR